MRLNCTRFFLKAALIVSVNLVYFTAKAQITLSPTDTTICPGVSYTIKGSFASSYAPNNSDDYFNTTPINIGFPFIYYGDTVTQLVVSGNNFISFDTSLAGAYSYWNYSDALSNGQLADAIMFPFEDLDFSTTSLSNNPGIINYQTFGSAPHRKFVLEFCTVPLYSCTSLKVIDELILYEGTNVIEMHITRKPSGCTWNGGTGVQGLRHNTSQALVTGRSAANVNWGATNDARRFTPNGLGGYTISTISFNPVPIIQNVTAQNITWYKEGSTNPIGTGDSVNVIANSSVNYYIAKISGVTCDSTTTQVFRDTSWVHFNTKYDTLTTNICSGESYSVGTHSYSSSGTYTDTFTAASGCDSIVTLHLTVNPVYHTTLHDSICSGGSYLFNGYNRTTAGTYYDTLQTVHGCDSFLTLHLTVLPKYNDTILAGVCPGGSYTFNNQTYTTAGFYTDTFHSVFGCDSFLTLHLINALAAADTISESICSGSSYHFHNQYLTTTGTYVDTFSTTYGCDSVVTLNLTVNPVKKDTVFATTCQGTAYSFLSHTYSTAGYHLAYQGQTYLGCDSSIYLHLTVNPVYHTTLHDSICSGGSYLFNGQNHTTSGTYYDTLQSVHGCDSFLTLHLTVLPKYSDTVLAGICPGSSYTFNGQTYTTAGIYTDTFQSVYGCDSLTTLHLINAPAATDTVSESICSGTSYHFHNHYLTTAGTYVDTFSTVYGCDSVVTLNLTVNPVKKDTSYATICHGSTYTFHGHTYSTAGYHLAYHGQTYLGCDSNIYLYLTVYPVYHTNLHDSICSGESYVFNGQSHTTSGNYSDTLQSVHGCDSVVTLHLTVLPEIQDTITAGVCPGESYVFNGQNYSTAGLYTDTFQSALGCDSLVTLNLINAPAAADTVSESICSGSSYHFHNQYLTTTGTYVDTFSTTYGCDSVVTLNLTVNPVKKDTVFATTCQGTAYSFLSHTYSTAGYHLAYQGQTYLGCDSSIYLHLTVNPVYHTTLHDSICSGGSYLFNGQNHTTSGTYYDTLQSVHGCDSFLTLHLTVLPKYSDTVLAGICPGSSYTFNGQTYTTAGIYTDTFQSVYGCDSLTTLHLINAPAATDTVSESICSGTSYHFHNHYLTTAGTYVDTFSTVYGCDSVVTLNLTVNPVKKDTVSATICQGSSYTFNGNNYSTAGFHAAYQGQTYLGCDSDIVLHLTVNPIYHDTAVHYICSGSSYTFNNNTYSTAGYYTDSFQSVHGCDSLTTLHLLIAPNYNDTIKESICSGSSYNFNNHNYSIAGYYTDTMQTIHGCDSIVTLSLTVNPIYHDSLTANICSGSHYSFNNHNYNTTGIYTDTLQTHLGCDSIVTLNLVVHLPYYDTVKTGICQGSSYTFNNTNYTVSGVYTDSFQSIYGCDSLTTLDLTVYPAINDTIHAYICSGTSYWFNNQSYSTSGIHTHTFTSIHGCDSTVTLHLTVNPPIYNTTVSDTICEGSNYVFNGQSYSVAGSYTDTLPSVKGCDSVVTLHLTVNPTYHDTVAANICHGSTYAFNGQSYSSAGFYVANLQTITGCDSIVTLNLTVNPVYKDTLAANICQGSGYLFNGQSYSATGLYTDTFQSISGCDSFTTLNLTVHSIMYDTVTTAICQGSSYVFNGQSYSASGYFTDTLQAATGCDSIVTLSLFVNPVFNDTISATICQGNSYSFAGQSYSTTGLYTDTLQTIKSCDSIVTLNLFVNPTYNDTLVANICQGDSYSFNGQNYSTTGYYGHTFQSDKGCDSSVTLNLIVHPIIHDSISATICPGSNYTFNSQNYSTAGYYTDTFQSVAGCDSFITLHLMLHPILYDTVTTAICQGSSYVFNGQSYSTTGYFTDTLQAATGCDSIVTLNLFVNPVFNDTISATICQGNSYSFAGQSYSTTGQYTDTLQTIKSCDSIVTLNLFVNPTYNDTLVANICQGDSYSFNGQNYSTTGYYGHTFQSDKGCDSSVTLNLIVHPIIHDSISATICPGSNYTFNSQNYSTAGYYTDTFQSVAGCDSFITLHLMLHPVYDDTISSYICYGQSYSLNNQNYTTSGTYVDTLSTINGCDSIVHLVLTVSPAPDSLTIDTAGCGSLTFEGTNYMHSTQFTDTLFNGHGCDSVYRAIHITVWSPVIANKDSSNCKVVHFFGHDYYQDTVITQNFVGSSGCDSFILHTHIHVNHPVFDTLVKDICIGTTYKFNNRDLNQSGTYSASFQGSNGCDSTSILMLTVHDLPEVTITATKPYFNYCIGDKITLTGHGAALYDWWATGSGTPLGSGEQITVGLNGPQNGFLVVGHDQWDCIDTGKIELAAVYCNQIFIPNAFSPNGDGNNDKFGAETNGHPTEFRMKIFNRYGQLIFTGYQPDEHWDGTYNGRPADLGTYYYYITGKYRNGEPFAFKGDFTLIR